MILILIALIFLYQLIFYKTIQNFKLSKTELIISALSVSIMASLLYIYYNYINIYIVCSFLTLTGMVNLSLTDIKYLEVDHLSYYFIAAPCLLMAVFSDEPLWEFALSLAFTFVVFFIIDKIFGIEGMGGADVKLLLSLSISVPYYDTFFFLFAAFLINLLLWIAVKLTHKNKCKIPMIVAITMGWLLTVVFF